MRLVNANKYSYFRRSAIMRRSSHGAHMITLSTHPVAPLLNRLFSETASPLASPAIASLSADDHARMMRSKTEYKDFYGRLKDVPLAVSRETGALLYMLA